MSKILNIDKTKRNRPYTTPTGFFDELEDNIWKEVKGEFPNTQINDCIGQVKLSVRTISRKLPKLRLFIGTALAAVASTVLVLMVNLKYGQQNSYSVNDVDQAFSQLSPDDQSFLLNVYQDDIFINE